MLVAAALPLLGACAGTPTNELGMPWWPQGPGDSAQETSADAAGKEAPSQTEVVAETAPAGRSVADEEGEAPTAVEAEKSGYTQAVRYGDLLFLSGQIGVDPDSGQLAGSTPEVQVEAAMENVQRVLGRHGMTTSNIVSVTLYLKRMADLPAIDEVYARYFRRALPARSVVAVNELPRGGLIEISVVAGR